MTASSIGSLPNWEGALVDDDSCAVDCERSFTQLVFFVHMFCDGIANCDCMCKQYPESGQWFDLT